MPILDLVLYPDQRLREVSEAVESVDDDTRLLLDDMAQTMYDAPGIGLAAPQIGVLKRLVVVDVGDELDEPRLFKLVNPEIIESSGSTSSEEGCLSIPDVRETVSRSARVVVSALNEDGEKLNIEAEGLLAICLQHEIDHLDGVLFIDHLSRLRKQLIKSKLEKLRNR